MTEKTTTSKTIENFLAMLREAEKEYNFSKESMINEENKTQDFLHKLELDNLNYSERAKVATQLAQNRKDRRKYKDEYEELQPVVEFINENKAFIHKLEELLGAVRKVEQRHSKRVYFPKANKEKGAAVKM